MKRSGNQILSQGEKRVKRLCLLMCICELDTWKDSLAVCLLHSGSNWQPEQNHMRIL